MKKETRILFVCTGNICRSPTAEYVLKKMLLDNKINGVHVESRGTRAFGDGEHADPRSIECAKKHGVDMSGHRVRQISSQDVVDFDLVLCAQIEHVRQVKQMVPIELEDKIKLFLKSFAPNIGVENLPDPYYGKEGGFERVFSLIEQGCRGIIDDIVAKRI